MDDISIEKLKEITEEFQKLKGAGKSTGQALDLLKDKMSATEFSAFSAKVSESASSMLSFAAASVESLKKMDTAFSSMRSGAETLSSTIKRAAKENNEALISTASVASNFLMPQLTSGMNAFEEFGRSGVVASTDINSSMSDMINALGPGTAEVFRLAEGAQRMRMGLYGLLQDSASAAGIMEGVDSAVIEMDKLDEAVVRQSKRIADIGGQALISPEKATEAFMALGQIPGALNSISESADDSANSMDATVQVINLSRGIGLDYMDVIKRQAEANYSFGTSAKDTVENLVMMNKAQQELGINKDVMLGFIDQATKGMGLLGDKTKSAIIMMETLGKAMKDSGMGSRAVGDLLSGTMQNMTNLDPGQAAYISQMSGGPGGLAGVMQIEALKQDKSGEGLAEILSMAGEAFQNMGMSEIVTLEDTQRDPNNQGLAQELYKQTEYLQKLGIAGDMTEATKILQAMKDGAFDKLADELKSPQERQEQLIERQNQLTETGNRLAARANTTLIAMATRRGELTRAEGLEASRFVDSVTKEEGFATADAAAERMSLDEGLATVGSENVMSTSGESLGTRETQAIDDKRYTQSVVQGGALQLIDQFKTVKDNMKEAVEIARNSIVEATAEATRMSANPSQDQQGRLALDGKIEMEVVLTDEERNIIVRRDFARTLEELTRKEKSRVEGPGIVSGS